MLAQAAGKIKAFGPNLTQALARPFVATADRFRLQGNEATSAGSAARFTAYFATSRREVMRAQRLRYRVFSEEYGAALKSPFGLDRDRYDKHCLHLLVRDNQTDELVGYTRVLHGSAAQRCGGYYSAGEFDLDMLARLDGRVAELGRTCIHPAYRGGAVITLLWSRLAQFMVDENIRYLVGCASVSLAEGYDLAAIAGKIRAAHLSKPQRRVTPKLILPAMTGSSEPSGVVKMPALLKAYLRMGARVCGEPCWDPDFNCVDFFVLLALEDLPRRYVQHFLQPAMPSALQA